MKQLLNRNLDLFSTQLTVIVMDIDSYRLLVNMHEVSLQAYIRTTHALDLDQMRESGTGVW